MLRPVFLMILLSLVSCDKFEMRGFVTGYESVNDRFLQSMEWNESKGDRVIIVPQDQYAVFACGDSHVGGTANLDLFFSDAAAYGAVATVLAGDITTGHGADYDEFYKHLPVNSSMAVFPTVGNHDLYFDGWKKFRDLFGTSVYRFFVKTPEATDLFICLDSGSATLGSRQLNWLKDYLRTERGSFRYCLIFTHNNLFRINHTFSTNPFVEEIRELADICVRYQINMVVTGHDHKRNVVELGNTVHITMDALEDTNKSPSYLILQMNGEKLDYSFVNFAEK